MATIVMVGTRKGLWIGRSDDERREWTWSEPLMAMEEVYSVMVDTRQGAPALLAGASSMWLGPLVRRSDDLGATWSEADGPRFPADVDASVERVWQLTPGTEPDVVYAGTEPGAVWRSDDAARSFALVRGLWDHPDRPQWGAGFGGQAFHTILPHPEDPRSVTAAISTGGVYRTQDAGASWQPRNQGIRAEFLPEGSQYPAFGQCVHKVARHPSRPERLYLQNHGGVYRSDDEGGRWDLITAGLPADFGFPVVVHPHDPDTIYLFPIGGGGDRFPVEGRARVWRSTDAGDNWQEMHRGLPDRFYCAVMRDAMCADDHDAAGLYVGARNGAVFASTDAGESWTQIVRNLPDVMCVRAARL